MSARTYAHQAQNAQSVEQKLDLIAKALYALSGDVDDLKRSVDEVTSRVASLRR